MINPIRQGMAIERRTLENRIRQDIGSLTATAAQVATQQEDGSYGLMSPTLVNLATTVAQILSSAASLAALDKAADLMSPDEEIS